MEKSEHYDAFISYRHLPKDEAIAKRLQVLLENYRPPRGLGVKQRINRVFLDRSELPTSQDLGQSLEDALLSSDYLIVILSEQTKESKWCMEEIRNFKKAHGGKTNRILPVLVSGEPGESLPEELCFEQVIEKAPDGSDILVQKEIEPLCCDVRGDNDAERLKKLKTEFLRIVAPMLGCGYDDLFQRHKRRQRRRLIISLSSVMMLFVVAISTLIYFNLKISASEQKYRANLMDSYVNTGNERAAEGKMQEALACYVKVLKDMPEHKKAKQGALLILQLFEWIYQEDSSSQVSFPEDDPIYGESHTVYLKNNPYAVSFPGEPPSFYDIERDNYLFSLNWDNDEKWTFELPDQASSAVNEMLITANKFSIAVQRGQTRESIAVAYKGCLNIFKCQNTAGKTNRSKIFKLYRQVDFGEFLQENFRQGMDIEDAPNFWISQDNDIAGIASNAVFFFVDTDTGAIKGSKEDNETRVKCLKFNSDGQRYAFARSAPSGTYFMQGTSVETGSVLNKYTGKSVSDREPGENFLDLLFSADSERVLWSQRDALIVLNYYRVGETAARLSLPQRIMKTGITPEGMIVTCNEAGENRYYRDIRFKYYSDKGYKNDKTEDSLDRFQISEDREYLEMLDENGSVIDRVQLFEKSNKHTKIYYEEPSRTVYEIHHATYGFDNYIASYIVSEDGTSIVSQDVIQLDYAGTFDAFPYPGGIAVIIDSAYIQMFRVGEQTPYRTIYPICEDNTVKILSIMVNSADGLLAIGLEDGYVELWDTDYNQCIASFTSKAHFDVMEIAMTEDGTLNFRFMFDDEYDDSKRLLLSAPDPDEAAIEALNNLCCYMLNDDNSFTLKDPTFNGDLGNWQNLFQSSYPFEQSK